MIQKLELPFPILSDPDRSDAIGPYGVANPDDPRNIAYPAVVIVGTDGEEAWRWMSRDFADRTPIDDIISALKELGGAPTTQDPPKIGAPEPGPKAMPLDQLGAYMRGARFAAFALGKRHGATNEAIKEDSKAYVAQMDAFLEAYNDFKARRG